MKLDRSAHRKMLTDAAECWPHYVVWDLADFPDLTEEDVAGNLLYLEELGLIQSGIHMGIDGHFSWSAGRATAAGLDFIQDDGGYSAILGTVTVKLHEDTLKALLVERIEKSDGDASVKGELIKQVKALPAEGLKTLTTKALEAGLAALPNAIALLHTWLSHA